MARSGFPSMTALLGLLAVAGYQNRDALTQMLGGRGAGGAGGAGMGGQGGLGGGLGGALGGLLGGQGGMGGRGGSPNLGSILGGLAGAGAGGGLGGGLGGLLGGGLGELNARMRQTGHGDAVDSWVGTGPNRQIEPHDLEAALGPDVLDDLTEQTGLPRQEVLARLSRELPEAVNQYTPHGRLPTEQDFQA